MAGHCIVPGLHSYWDHDIWYFSWMIRGLVTIGYRHICLYIVNFSSRTISLKLANKKRQIFTKNNYYFLNYNIDQSTNSILIIFVDHIYYWSIYHWSFLSQPTIGDKNSIDKFLKLILVKLTDAGKWSNCGKFVKTD